MYYKKRNRRYWNLKSPIFSPLNASADSCSFLFLLSIYLSSFSLFVFGLITMIDHFKLIQIFPFTCNFMWFIKLRASVGMFGVCAWVGAGVRMCVRGYAWVCVGKRECAWVCPGVCGCGRVCVGICWYARVYAGVCTGVHWCVRGYAWVYACVWDEFSEYLLENRVPTSVDFNTYPIRIFNDIWLETM